MVGDLFGILISALIRTIFNNELTFVCLDGSVTR